MVGNQREDTYAKSRFWWLIAVAWLFLFILIFRLFSLQIVNGENYFERSRSNFLQERRLAHTRGLIFDQAGVPLVDNRPAKDVYVTLGLMPDSERSLRRLGPFLNLNRNERRVVDRKVLAEIKKLQVQWVSVKAKVPAQACSRLDAFLQKSKMAGVQIEWEYARIQSCHVFIDPLRFPSRAGVLRRLTDLLELGDQDGKKLIAKMIRKSRGLGKFKPIPFMMDVGFKTNAALEAAVSVGTLPGVSVLDGQRRRYIEGDFATHVLGFMNELSPKELERNYDNGYRMGDMIGRRGIESVYESILRGTDGKEKVVVDAKGRKLDAQWADDLLGKDRYVSPTSGQSVVLSVDSRMQRRAEEAFMGRAGSVVAIEVNTGFVLALASFPDYDPNLMNSKQRSTLVHSLNTNKDKPWINKALQEHYAPGSTFKAITAVSGLQNKEIGLWTNQYCPGYYKLGRSKWRCFHRGGHGHIALAEAMKESCDTYFYSLGYELGIDKLSATSKLLGFGHRTGIDLDGEIPGIVPSREWYKSHHRRYSPGFVVNNAIGQGDVAVTPLQLATAYAALINGGIFYRPQLVREVWDEHGQIVATHEPEVLTRLPELKDELNVVRRSMAHITDKGGTAHSLMYRKDLPDMSLWLRDSGMVLGGKTGTAQVVRLAKNIAHLDPKDVAYEKRDHAWFVGFMPVDNPEVIIVTMTEHGGFGGSISAPVTAQVAMSWFENVRGHGRFANYPPLKYQKFMSEIKPDLEPPHVDIQ
jgi:penicillin-binding protein 2